MRLPFLSLACALACVSVPSAASAEDAAWPVEFHAPDGEKWSLMRGSDTVCPLPCARVVPASSDLSLNFGALREDVPGAFAYEPGTPLDIQVRGEGNDLDLVGYVVMGVSAAAGIVGIGILGQIAASDSAGDDLLGVGLGLLGGGVAGVTVGVTLFSLDIDPGLEVTPRLPTPEPRGYPRVIQDESVVRF